MNTYVMHTCTNLMTERLDQVNAPRKRACMVPAEAPPGDPKLGRLSQHSVKESEIV